MNCFEAQSLITKYLNNELDDEKVIAFLEHIDSCPDCSEELEIYFTVMTGLRQLDNDKDLTDNYPLALKKKIAFSRNDIFKRKKKRFRNIASLVIVVGIITPLLLGIESSQVNNKDQIVYTDVDESNYEFEYYYDYDLNNLSEYVKDNEDEIREYIAGLKSNLEENDEQDSID